MTAIPKPGLASFAHGLRTSKEGGRSSLTNPIIGLLVTALGN
jgi:hypothetical protein